MHMEYRQFAKPAAVLVLGAGAAAWAIVNSGGSGDAAPEQSFIPDTALAVYEQAGVALALRLEGTSGCLGTLDAWHEAMVEASAELEAA